MSKKEEISLPKGTKIPDHTALILDGNRRWARAKGLSTFEGHMAGFRAMKEVVKAARDFGIHTLTLWGFSTENWDRSPEEIAHIMKILKKFVKEFRKEAGKYEVRLIHLGRKDRLPKDFIEMIGKAEKETKDYRKHVLNIALDYGGRDEILRAVKQIVEDGVPKEKIDEKLFASYLDTGDQPYPYPDLFIRPSGEQRTSGLLPWQMAYTEYYWEESHLPDFTPEKLRNAILDYSRRRRRFGGNDAVLHFAFEPKVVANLELSWWRLKKIPEGERFIDYALRHVEKQYGLSKSLATTAAHHLLDAVIRGDRQEWEKGTRALSRFYKLIKGEVKLAFEPAIVASLEMKLIRETKDSKNVHEVSLAEGTARELYAEVYRISLLQAAKAAHLRVLATVERNLAEAGFGEQHWVHAEDYLQKFYRALKEQVA